MSVGAVPGALIADKWDRKWLVTFVAIVIAVCGLLYGATFKIAMIIVFGFLVAMFLQVFAPLLYAYTAECYPTHVRNSGTGLAYGVGRLANVLGPLIVAYLFEHRGYQSVFNYVAVMWISVAVIVGGRGPRTKESSLG